MHRKALAYLFLLIFLFLPWESAQSDQAQQWAVLIEESSFEGHAFADAVKRALLDGGWKKTHIQLVKENSSSAFYTALNWLVSNAGEDDTVLVYFSGHGYSGGLEMGPEKITYDSVNGTLGDLSAYAQFIVLDACHSGSAMATLNQEGRIIISSCRGDETSGYFSDPFINALGAAADCNGNLDDVVSAEETFAYIMSDWHIEGYTPQMQDDYEGTLPLLSVGREGKQPEVFQTHAQRSLDNFEGEKWLRQSFVPLSSPIVGISLRLAKWKNATDAYVEIRDKSSTVVGGAFLSVESAQDVSNVSTWIFLDIDVDVVPGDTYFVVCRSNATWWWWGSGQWYPQGEASVSSDGGQSWRAHTKLSDFSFIIYGERDIIPPDVSLFHPNGGDLISGISQISWAASDNSDDALDGNITLSLSNDSGITWQVIAAGVLNNGMYTWDTTYYRDGTTYVLRVAARDSAGNSGQAVSDGTFTVDNTPPETLCEAYGERGTDDWYVNTTAILLSGYDALLDVVLYYNHVGQWREYTQPLVLHTDGRHNVSYYAEDAAGNRAPIKTVTVQVDTTPPTISFLMPEDDYLYFFGKKIFPLTNRTILIGKTVVQIRARDATSGISHVTFFRDETQVCDDIDEPYEWEWTSPLFTHDLTCTAYDHAGNHAQITRTIFSLSL